MRAEPAYGLFACQGGGMLSLSIAHEDHFWQALCRLLGLPDAAGLQARHRIARSAELRGSRYSTSLHRGAPALGEHTRQVLGGDAAACGELDGGGPQHVATNPRTGSNSKE